MTGPRFWKKWTLKRLLRKLPIVDIAEGTQFDGMLTVPMASEKVCYELLEPYKLPYLKEVCMYQTNIYLWYGGSTSRRVFRIGPNQYRVVHGMD